MAFEDDLRCIRPGLSRGTIELSSAHVTLKLSGRLDGRLVALAPRPIEGTRREPNGGGKPIDEPRL